MKKVALILFLVLFSCKQQVESDKLYLNVIQLSIEEYNEEYDLNRYVLESKSTEQPLYYKDTFEKLKIFEKSVSLFKDESLSFEEKKKMVKELQTDLIHKFGLEKPYFLSLTTSDEKLFNEFLAFDISRNSKNLSKHLIQIHLSSEGWVK